MGEGTRPATLYFAREDGSGTPIPCGFEEWTLPNDCVGNVERYPVQSLDGLTMEVKSKHLRCHSRKRFVKLLMGRGWSRNAANARARRRRKEGMTYSHAWWLECFSSGPFFS